jgi:alpha-beta hydrolase superfamily lysophospholipase
MAYMLKEYKGVYYQDWPVSNAKAAVLMVHGMGAHSRRYAYLSERLNTESISGYAIELQGFGELSGGKPGHVESMKKYHDGITLLKELIKAENPGKPVFILGESMGGLIATTQVLNYDPDYRGLVAIVPAYKDVLKISPLDRLKIFFTSIVNNEKGINMPFTSEELTSDPEILAKIKADPREHRVASANLLRENLLEQLNIMFNIGKMKTPVLMLLSGRDMLVDTNFSLSLFKKIKADKEYKLYKDSLHALTIENNREEVFKDIIVWINKKL